MPNAMQYAIDLPADYDMTIIRDRVRDRHGATDTLPGLGAKAYLIRERGTDGAQANQYATFYLWNDPAAQAGFLLGDGFAGLCASFGRPVVHGWVTHGVARGPAVDQAPRSASRVLDQLEQDADLAAYAAEEARWLAQQSGGRDVVLAAVGIDPSLWQGVRLTLSIRSAADGGDRPGDRYEVLHLSRPGIDALD